MDNLQLQNPEANNDDISEDEESQTTMKRTSLLHVSPSKRRCKESGFHKSTRLCLVAIRDAVLHHRWQEAAQYLQVYTETLEDTTSSKQSVACEIIWRLGAEILKHQPHKDVEQFTAFYERMKYTGVKNYAKVCLEHAFHLLLHGHIQKAKQQLSVAMSWRYGKQSAKQSLELKLIHAYCGFMDYLIWSSKRSSVSDAEDCVNSHELHSYFRQASVTLQELIKHPGVWDPFVWGCIDMFEFYNAEEEVLQILQNYANNKDYPSNPNAHVYLYKHQKRHKASTDELLSTLKGLHSLVPSHELMLDYCTLLIQSEEQEDLQHALSVALNLLEYSSWKTDMDAWKCLLKVLQHLKKLRYKTLIIKEMEGRKELWMKMHFKSFHNRKDSKENATLVLVKVKAGNLLGIYNLTLTPHIPPCNTAPSIFAPPNMTINLPSIEPGTL
ncbi:TATA box-binding protein-associated factor RNA polymerase I subunit A [Tachysurus ichikawai]